MGQRGLQDTFGEGAKDHDLIDKLNYIEYKRTWFQPFHQRTRELAAAARVDIGPCSGSSSAVRLPLADWEPLLAALRSSGHPDWQDRAHHSSLSASPAACPETSSGDDQVLAVPVPKTVVAQDYHTPLRVRGARPVLTGKTVRKWHNKGCR
jgi:hypothetical protein